MFYIRSVAEEAGEDSTEEWKNAMRRSPLIHSRAVAADHPEDI